MRMIRLRDGDEERLLTMDEFERTARRGEISPLAWVCVPNVTHGEFVQARHLDLFNQVYDPRRFHFRRHFHVVRFPALTLLLAAACCVLYVVAVRLGDGAATAEVLMQLGAKSAVRIIEEGESFRLLSANLLNRDLVHLSFNLVALLAVSTVLEGVYRRGDLLALFVLSGIGSMGLSSVFTHSTTVGASGLVFGCLGAAAAFGWRYRDILPRRYRAFFGSVILSYTALMFYLGVVNDSTDNFAHAGGLAIGIAFGAVVQPRLMRLTDARESKLQLLAPYVVSGVLCALVVGVGPLLPTVLFRWAPVEVDAFGLQLQRPLHWRRVPGPLNFLAFGNGLDAFISVGCARLDDVSVLADAHARFSRDLNALEQSGNVSLLDIGTPVSGAIGQDGGEVLPSLEVPFSFVERNGHLTATASLFSRGQLECALVLAHRPSASTSTTELLQRMRRQVLVQHTSAQTAAQRAADAAPDAPKGWLELALAHQVAGDVRGARRALSRAESQVSDGDEVLVQVAFARTRFELALGNDFAAAKRALRRAMQVGGARVDLKLLQAQVHFEAGERDEADAVLQALAQAHPDDAVLREQMTTLRTSWNTADP